MSVCVCVWGGGVDVDVDVCGWCWCAPEYITKESVVKGMMGSPSVAITVSR